MKGDFSRITFRPDLQYTRVLAQQGRVDMDADRNETHAILLERMRLGFIDTFGPFGGPRYLYDAGAAWRRDNEGFLIQAERSGPNVKALNLGAGRYYVEGWTCSTTGARDDDGMDQPALPTFPENLIAAPPYLVYLDVWERLRTNLDDALMSDIALNGIDTSARAELVCQVRFIEAGDLPYGSPALGTFSNTNFIDWWPAILEQLRRKNPPRLKVAALRPADSADNPCLADAQTGYTGPENQLYRVEIHKVDPNSGEVTFLFSRDNNSIAAPLEDIDGRDLRISGIFEPSRGFSAGQWVEITSDHHELLAQPGTMVKVVKVEGEVLTIDPDSADGSLDPNDFPKEENPKVRRWDQTGRGPLTLKDGAIVVEEGKPIQLEYGIEITFEKPAQGIDPHTYRTGDFWIFPARYLSGDVEWPKDAFLPPHGVIHAYAPLAVVDTGAVIDLRFLKDPWG